MFNDLFVLSNRLTNRALAMSCVVELEDVLERQFGAKIVYAAADIKKSVSDTVVFFVALDFSEVEKRRAALYDLKQRGAKVLIYVFDSWNVKEIFYNFNRKLKSSVFKNFSLHNICNQLIVPFSNSIADFNDKDRALILHCPLGVDTTRVNGSNSARPITVLAYGRQPIEFTKYLSERLNVPEKETIMHHTDHMTAGTVLDFYAHRRHFWKMAQNSAVALAYDPRITHPERFPYSIVGQRWFECLAAGCAVLGSKPSTSEVGQLLNWEDATIELPRSFSEAEEFILDLVHDQRRLTDIRERNVQQMQEFHDWALRMKPILARQ